jgi:IgGFc binding protein
MRSTLLFSLLVPALITLGACANTEGEEVCAAGSYRCSGSTALLCVGGGWKVETDCASTGKICSDKGCIVCQPAALVCKGLELLRCNDSGTGYLSKPVKVCDGNKGLVCDSGDCVNACDLARANRSYVGCEYWAVDLDNAVVEVGSAAAQQFAVALSNPSSLPATVTVSYNEAEYGKPAKLKEAAKKTIKPNGLQIVLLPSREVDGSPSGQYDAGSGTAVTTHAYKVSSTAPIIAYQFNPLSNVGVFSNDASLLVPTPALTTDASNENGAAYAVMSWPQTIATTTDKRTNFGLDLRAFLTIVGTRAGTNVKVQLSTDTISDGKDGRVKAMKKGETLTYKLEPFDVLNLETGGFGADFTGTRVSTDKPVVVFSGSEASDVPNFFDLTTRKCCADHLEHQLFPMTTLGTTFVALTTPSRTQALYDAGATISVKKEKEYFRILAAGEFTSLTTNLPAPDTHQNIGGNQFTQLRVDRDFTIQTTEPVVVGQFVAGQDEAGIPSSLPGGDPSFILLPPVEQFRKDYLFLTPDKYHFDFIMVAAPRTASVVLDGRKLKVGCDTTSGRKVCCKRSDVGKVRAPGATSDTDYVAYKCQLSFPKVIPSKNPPDNLEAGDQNDGVHYLVADQKIGLVVYGFDAYVSYGYPGGTDLALINIK